MTDDTDFAPGVDRWVAGLGRLRDVVRQELVARQLAEIAPTGHGRAPLRVLDAGCGQGTQALRLARAGHRVTGLDPSADLLDRFATAVAAEPPEVRGRVALVQGRAEEATRATPGPFDLVLCHGVLMYVADVAPMLTALAGVTAADGVLSLLVRNGLAPAMRAGLLGDWAGALAAFDRREYTNRLGLPAYAHAPSDLDAVLARLGLARDRWFGVRVFTDHRDEPAPTDRDELDLLLGAEDEAGRRDPYRSAAALLHLVYRR